MKEFKMEPLKRRVRKENIVYSNFHMNAYGDSLY